MCFSLFHCLLTARSKLPIQLMLQITLFCVGARALVSVLQELARATVATALPEAAVCHLAGAAIASHLLEVVMNQQMVTEVLLSKRLVGA